MVNKHNNINRDLLSNSLCLVNKEEHFYQEVLHLKIYQNKKKIKKKKKVQKKNKKIIE